MRKNKASNRIDRLTSGGILYESDPRNAEHLLRTLDINSSLSVPSDNIHQIEQGAVLNDDDHPQQLVHPDDEEGVATDIRTVGLRQAFFHEQPGEQHHATPYAGTCTQHPRRFVNKRDGTLNARSAAARPYTGNHKND